MIINTNIDPSFCRPLWTPSSPEVNRAFGLHASLTATVAFRLLPRLSCLPVVSTNCTTTLVSLLSWSRSSILTSIQATASLHSPWNPSLRLSSWYTHRSQHSLLSGCPEALSFLPVLSRSFAATLVSLLPWSWPSTLTLIQGPIALRSPWNPSLPEVRLLVSKMDLWYLWRKTTFLLLFIASHMVTVGCALIVGRWAALGESLRRVHNGQLSDRFRDSPGVGPIHRNQEWSGKKSMRFSLSGRVTNNTTSPPRTTISTPPLITPFPLPGPLPRPVDDVVPVPWRLSFSLLLSFLLFLFF